MPEDLDTDLPLTCEAEACRDARQFQSCCIPVGFRHLPEALPRVSTSSDGSTGVRCRWSNRAALSKIRDIGGLNSMISASMSTERSKRRATGFISAFRDVGAKPRCGHPPPSR